jgi:predicted regulator of Ras-like GTPase activity (Roadblock/LC7/MglB family)
VSERERLDALMALPGVRGAGVASADGEMREVVGAGPGDEAEVRDLIAGSLASSRALAELFGDGELRQATVGFDRGPVLLQPLPGAGGRLLVALLEHDAAMGRVRAALAAAAGPPAAAAGDGTGEETGA